MRFVSITCIMYIEETSTMLFITGAWSS